MDSLLNNAPCGYVSFRDDGVIIRSNETLARWLHVSTSELPGRKIESIFTLATRIFYNTHFFPLIKLHQKAEEIYLALSAAEQKEIPVLANAHRQLEGDSYIINCVFIPVFQRKKFEQEILSARREAEKALTDNQHLRELQDKLEKHTLEVDRQYQKLLDLNRNLVQFSKIISHDLQEPLHKIKVYGNMVLSTFKNELETKNAERIAKILFQADRLSTLITGLSQYVSVDDERAHTEVDLHATVEAAKVSASNTRGFFDFDVSYEKFPVIDGYPAQLQLLFFHLFDNAIKFRDPSRRLCINISAVSLDENRYRHNKEKYSFVPHLRLTFEDNGIGFDNEYKDYVFDLLKKLQQQTAGLGIGLSLVKKIIENHLGSIEVTSEKGKGTAFIMYLPLRMS